MTNEKEYEWWALSTQIDLYDCNPQMYKSKQKLEQFILEICELLSTFAKGECNVISSSDGEKTLYSVMQRTGHGGIMAHFDETSKNGHINVLHNKLYEPDDLVLHIEEFFEAKDSEISTKTSKATNDVPTKN